MILPFWFPLRRACDIACRMSDNMSYLAQVMFLKAVILSFWVAFKEAREAGAIDRAWQSLLARFNSEWNRRRAKQPLMLTDQRTDLREQSRSIK